MTMVELGPRQRALFAETLRDVANIAAGAMVFGQFLGERPLSPRVALLGLTVWAALVIFATSIIGRKDS